MHRLVALSAVLAFVSVCHTATHESHSIVVTGGNIGAAFISGGVFGDNSFSINNNGRRTGPSGQTNITVTKDGNGEHILVQATSIQGEQDNKPQPNHSGGSNSGNTQLYPVTSKTLVYTGQGGGNGGGSVVVDAVVNNFSNQLVTIDTDADGFSVGSQGSIVAITGGNIGILNSIKPAVNVTPKKSAVSSKYIRHNTENEAPHSKDISVNSNVKGNVVGAGYTHDSSKTDYNAYRNDERWIWNR